MSSREVKSILKETIEFAKNADERAFAKFFRGNDLQWILRAARSGVWSSVDTEGLEALVLMSTPVGGLENFARILDRSIGRWPSRDAQRPDLHRAHLQSEYEVQQRRRRLRYVALELGHSQRAASEVNYFMNKNLDPKGLSGEALSLLFFMFMVIYQTLDKAGTIQGGLEAISTGVATACEIQNSLVPVSNDYPTLEELRERFCGVGKPDSDIDKIRSVKGVKVQMRQGPSKKHGLVLINLEDRDLLIAIDETNPEWAHVRLVTDPNVTGWIAKKYVHVPRK